MSPNTPDPKASDLVEGEDFYREGPYVVFTETYLRKRGYCCESGCRHCPYKNVEGTEETDSGLRTQD